jgi:membrane protease subunit (stomatin/prohibitin family)
MKVIQYADPTGQTIVARVPKQGTAAIKIGSQLIVEESQEAVFLRDGRALDTFGPGRHTLATQNLPLLTRLIGIPFDGKSPFQAAVIFVSTKTFIDLKWGTKEPVAYRDSELAMIRLRAFGKFAARVVNSQLFVNTIVGTNDIYTTDGVEAYFKDVIVARFTDILGENLQSIFDLPKVYDELGMALKSRVAEDFSKYGLELVDLYLGAITPPKDVQKLIDERAGMAAVGDMNAYMKFKAAKAMGDAAQQTGGETGGGVGAGLGVGMGAGMGMMLPQMMKEAMQDQGGQGAPSGVGGGAAAAGSDESTTEANQTAGGAAAAASAAFCHQCGEKLPDGAKFCPSCGTKMGG